MVENAYERRLMEECQKQGNYHKRLHQDALKTVDANERRRKLKIYEEFELTHCDKLRELFPARSQQRQGRF